MATTVAQHSVATFTSPVNGTTPIDANTVRGNDNTIRTSYNDHDADTGIHVQSSTLASRPAAGTAGRKWITDDSGVYTLWFDDGTNWHPVSSENIALSVLAGENLVKGDVVKVTGWNNGQDLPEVVKTTSASDTAFAVITAAVSNGSMGYATNTGIVQDVNTAAYSVGTVLYANGSGGFTSTKPTSGHYQPVAYVLRSNASNGVYYVEFSTPRIVESSANTASTVVLRDASGNFAAGTITAGAVTSTGLVTFASLKGTGATTVTDILNDSTMATASATTLATSSSIKTYVDNKVATVDTLAEVLANGNTTGAHDIIVNAGQKLRTPAIAAQDGSASISIANTTGALTLTTALADSNLATISTAGKVSNSATTATSANTASAIVARDASGNFSAGTITATLSGSASSLTTSRNLWGQAFNGSADVTGNLTSVGNITGTAGVTVTATSGTLALAATGANNVNVSTNGATRWRVNSAGHLLAETDATYDIGASGATRPRNIYTSGDITVASVRVGQGAGAVTSNTIVGDRALNANTSGVENTAVGALALFVNTTGSYNTAFGGSLASQWHAALRFNTTGSHNAGFGDGAVAQNTTASYNTGMGTATLYSNQTGSNNTAVGYQALYNLANTANNTAIGYTAGSAITSGAKNTLLGCYSGNQDGVDIRTASNNIVLSDGDGNARLYYDGASNFWAFRNGGTERWRINSAGHLLAGTDATYDIGASGATRPRNIYTSGDITVAGLTVGRGGGSLTSNTTVGSSALGSNTTGANNVAVGVQALRVNTTDNNTAVGYQAGYTVSTGYENTAVGSGALYTTGTGYRNVAVGYFALYSNSTGQFNSAVGYQAARNFTGTYNTTFGGLAGGSGSNSSNGNTLVGYASGYATTGISNTFVGAATSSGVGCGEAMTTGNYNTIVGAFSGNTDGLDIRTSSNYAVIADGQGNRLLSMYNGGTLALDGGAVPQSGTGITFPATQSASSNANTLDDYEEGTWTPGISFGGASTGVTYNTTYNNASYTKIGDTVIVRGALVLSAKGSSTGDARLTGLPFTSANAYVNGGVAIGPNAITFTGQVWMGNELNATTMLLIQTTEAGARSYLTHANFADNSDFSFEFSYRV